MWLLRLVYSSFTPLSFRCFLQDLWTKELICINVPRLRDCRDVKREICATMLPDSSGWLLRMIRFWKTVTTLA